MSAEYSVSKLNITFRVSPYYRERIDRELERGEFTTQSSLLNHMVERYFSEEDQKSRIRADLLDLLKSDPEIRQMLHEDFYDAIIRNIRPPLRVSGHTQKKKQSELQ